MRIFWMRSVGTALLLGSTPSVRAQPPAAAPASPVWIVTDDAFADLWYHCLAAVGYDGFGPLPLYDPSYATRAATRLAPARARGAAHLRRLLAADSAFEALHFFPLHVLGQSPREVLEAIDEAAGGRPASQQSRAAIAARALVASLPTSGERATLRALASFASAEWSSFERERADDVIARRRRRDSEQRFARDTVLSALSPYLEAFGVRGGTIVASAAIGAEGRFMLGPGGRAVVVVGASLSDDPHGPVLAAVRELAFPIVHATLAGSPLSSDRVAAERDDDRAATRAGALLLETALPALAARYRTLYVPDGDARSFAARFPVDSAAIVSLRRAIAAAAPAAVPARH